MKKLIIIFIVVSTNVFAQEYPKVILKGDYPDPTIVRDGEDYYMTHSPFYYMPGFLIWHSQDLVNWEPIVRAVSEYEGSAMAPELIKYEGRFYLYFPSDGTNWVAWADNIMGPWSRPIDLKVGGIDPGHIADEDGNRYLYLNDGWVIKLSEDGLSTVGEKHKKYDGWEFPKDWITEGMWLESPKLVFKDGYYYMTSAQGGTAGPPTSHMAVSARSKNVLGPWENSPYNPSVHTYDASENWWSKGHGTIIDDVNGNWWIVYHAYENGYYTLGRQTLIEPIEWTSDGWYKTSKTAHVVNSDNKIKHGIELSDDFNSTQLGLQWTFWKSYNSKQFCLDGKVITLIGKGKTVADANLMLTTPTKKTYTTQVDVEVSKKSQAGLLLFYSEEAFVGLVSDGETWFIYSDVNNVRKIPNNSGKNFRVKILNDENNCTFLVSKDGQKWDVVAENINVSTMHHNSYLGFYALRPAIVCMGKGISRFDNFICEGNVDL